MKSPDPLKDFIREVSPLNGFILILNTIEEKILFEKKLLYSFSEKFPLSAIAFSYEFIDNDFINSLTSNNIKYGIKIHPRLSKVTIKDFKKLAKKLEKIFFRFLIIDCFYYGSKLEYHINLELSIFLAKHFKDKKVLLAHGGGHKVLEYMLYTRELQNIYYDFSLTSNYLKNTSVRQDIKNFIKYNHKKVFFGSDYPDFTVKQSIETYKELISECEITKVNIQKIFYENVLSFLEEH
jgi:hypothetical protein